MNAREVALAVVRDVFADHPRSAREALEYRAGRAALDDRDRAFAMELAFGAIRMRRLLDWHLEPFVGERLRTLPPTIREILRLGTQQLVRMHVEPRAAVHETVSLALRHGHRGTAGLVNAVLRRVAETAQTEPPREAFPTDDDFLATAYSMPTWIVAQWRERFGSERIVEILEAVNTPSRTAVTFDPRQTDVEGVRAALEVLGAAADPSPIVPQNLVLGSNVRTPALEAEAAGRWWIQGETAAMPVDILDPKPGERIVEFAAGRGNKTRQLATRSAGEAQIEAVELDARRAAQLRAWMLEHDLTSVAVVEGDATLVPDDPERAGADAALVDAPCTGLGIVGRQPEARWRKSPDDADRLATTQRAMLSAAVARLRAGGRVVYSVCSTDRREAEDVVESVLAEDVGLARVPMPERYAPLLTPAGDVLVPPGIDGRDGFYIALLRRAVV